MNKENDIPLYPNEAYKNEEERTEKQDQNPLVPLLLSALSKGDNNDLLKLLLTSQSQGEANQSGLVSALAGALGNLGNKKKTQQSVEPKTEKAFPKNEYI